MKLFLKSVAIGLVLSLALPSFAFGKSFDEKISKDTLWSLEYQLPEFLEPWLTRDLDEEGKKDINVQKLLSGERFLYTRPLVDSGNSYTTYENSFKVLPATEEEFQMVKQDDEKYPFEEKSYNGQTYWRTLLEGRTLMHDGEHAFVIPYEPMVNGIIDVIQGITPALSQNPSYAKMKSALPWDSALVSFFYDVRAAIDKEASEGGSEFSPTSQEYALLSEIFQSLGSTFLKTSYGYEWKLKIDQSQEALAKNGLEFTPGGFFTPSLYRKFPNAPVLAYLESNNWKGRLDAWKKFISAFVAAGASITGDPASTTEAFFTEIFLGIHEDFDIDIQPLFQALQGKIAFALQDTGDRIPSFTALTDISSDLPAAEGFLENLKIALQSGFDPEKIPDPSITKSSFKIGRKDFTQFRINFTHIAGYEGPDDFPPLHITAGITDENLLLVSTDPNIAVHYGQGLHNNRDFMAAYQNRDTPVLGITYIGLRNFWNFTDRFIAWRLDHHEDTKHALPFSFIRHYLKMLEDIYFAREIFIEKNVEDDMLTYKAKIFTDTISHETFLQWKTRMSSQDTDRDGLDDYRERFTFYTDPDVPDSDGDGVDDSEEIRLSTDPHNIHEIFEDVPEQLWYNDAVSNLYKRGSITGYPDSTFRPSKTVTRAEFTCMAARALDIEFKKITGMAEVSEWAWYDGVYNPYNDINSQNWYFSCIQEAYQRHLIYAQGIDFRPNEPITRAEATAILIRMDDTLQKKVNDLRWAFSQTYDLPFTDVPQNAWFYYYIRVAYLESLVSGRSSDTFSPLANMTRAEGAKMLYGVLSRRLHILEESQGSPLDDKLDDVFFEFLKSNF